MQFLTSSMNISKKLIIGVLVLANSLYGDLTHSTNCEGENENPRTSQIRQIERFFSEVFEGHYTTESTPLFVAPDVMGLHPFDGVSESSVLESIRQVLPVLLPKIDSFEIWKKRSTIYFIEPAQGPNWRFAEAIIVTFNPLSPDKSNQISVISIKFLPHDGNIIDLSRMTINGKFLYRLVATRENLFPEIFMVHSPGSLVSVLNDYRIVILMTLTAALSFILGVWFWRLKIMLK